MIEDKHRPVTAEELAEWKVECRMIFCAECGPTDTVDEDGCCPHCGATVAGEGAIQRMHQCLRLLAEVDGLNGYIDQLESEVEKAKYQRDQALYDMTVVNRANRWKKLARKLRQERDDEKKHLYDEMRGMDRVEAQHADCLEVAAELTQTYRRMAHELAQLSHTCHVFPCREFYCKQLRELDEASGFDEYELEAE